ncbi:MAG: sugar phosphate isomerase/epimerase [Cyclobacteriaceae bacterium]|jgi:sugar phosphate isomerase/epimerase|nr:sugar phosphate isomerase/epimerase [Cyclobacteriaceae bacterium]
MKTFGIQLWSVKDEMVTDPTGTLKKLASFGYTQIETFEGEKGICWGMKPLVFKEFLNDLGLDLVAAHCPIDQHFDKKVEEAVLLGLDYLVCPWLGPQETADQYRKAAEQFNVCGEKCFQAGLFFAYHNHDYSFIPVDGKIPQKLFLEITNPEWVFFEMDIYWVELAGEDPVKWLTGYPGRWPIVHLKDKANDSSGNRFISTELGKGTIDYPGLIKACQRQAVHYYMVEQERFAGTTPLLAARANAEYMRAL